MLYLWIHCILEIVYCSDSTWFVLAWFVLRNGHFREPSVRFARSRIARELDNGSGR